MKKKQLHDISRRQDIREAFNEREEPKDEGRPLRQDEGRKKRRLIDDSETPIGRQAFILFFLSLAIHYPLSTDDWFVGGGDASPNRKAAESEELRAESKIPASTARESGEAPRALLVEGATQAPIIEKT